MIMSDLWDQIADIADLNKVDIIIIQNIFTPLNKKRETFLSSHFLNTGWGSYSGGVPIIFEERLSGKRL